MAKVYLDYMYCVDEQDPKGSDNNDEIYYLVESSSTKQNVSRSFDVGDPVTYYPNPKLLENDAATTADPLFFSLWEDDPSKDDQFTSISRFAGGDPGTIKDGGIYFDGTPGVYDFRFSGNGGVYDVVFSVT